MQKKVKTPYGEIETPDYDPEIITEFAARLYAQAKWAILNYTIGFAFIGGFFGGISQGTPLAFLAAVVLGGIGYSIGVEHSFKLKLQAQTALCQREIAKNTNKDKGT